MNAPAKILSGDGDDAFRASHVGASEVAALFDCHPWLTRFELWQRKAGSIATPAFNEIGPDGAPLNERAYWGVKLEESIIAAAIERWGYVERPEPHLRLSNSKGLGGHPDRRVSDARGPGILEAKAVDWLERKKWGDEPPLSYLLQNQTYIGLDGALWGDIILLVGGNKLDRVQFDLRPGLYAEIEKRADEFWKSVRAGKPPKPDYSRDANALKEIYAAPSDTVIDLRLDNRMPSLAQEYLEATEAKRAAEARVDALQAELLDKLGDNTLAMVDGYSVRVPVVTGQAEKVITADMVGQVIKGRKSHRRFYIKERTE